jgi:methylated-DNA-protein-cysteine methyltransferase-like protein
LTTNKPKLQFTGVTMKKEEFFLEVYEIVKLIPGGKVTTYGTIAQIMGRPQCSRMTS